MENAGSAEIRIIKDACEREERSIRAAIQNLLQWIDDSGGKSYDPYDLRSVPRTMGGFRVPVAALDLANRICPNLARRYFGVEKGSTATGYSNLVSAYCKLARVYTAQREEFLAKAHLAADLLIHCRIKGGGWGLEFDWVTGRGVRIPKGTTLSYTTYTALSALMELADLTCNPKFQ